MKKQRLFSLCNVFLCLLRCQNRFVRLFVHKAYLPNIPKGCLPFFQMLALEHQSLGRCLHQNRLDRIGLFDQYNGCCFLKRSWHGIDIVRIICVGFSNTIQNWLHLQIRGFVPVSYGLCVKLHFLPRILMRLQALYSRISD